MLVARAAQQPCLATGSGLGRSQHNLEPASQRVSRPSARAGALMTPPLLAHSAVATTRLSPAVQEPRVALNPSPESTDRPSFAPNAASVAIAAGAAVAFAAVAAPAQAFSLHMEPANALSLPTWAVHTSSLIEWVTAMGLMWKYADVTGNQKWKGMTWGMLPFFCSGLCACTWHLFYNSPDLELLVSMQAGLTVLGNFTCWLAAYRIYEAAQTEKTS